MSLCKICSTLDCASKSCAEIITAQAESIARRASNNSNELPGQLRRELDQVYQWAGRNGYDLAADWIALAALQPGSGVPIKLLDDGEPVTPFKALHGALMRLESLSATFHARKQCKIGLKALEQLESSIKDLIKK